MNHRVLCLLLPLLLPLFAADRDEKELLTLEQVAGRGAGVRFSGRAPAWRWAEDGVHLKGPDEKWQDPGTGREVEPPEQDERAARERDERKQAEIDAFAALDGVDEDRARQITARGGEQSRDGSAVLYRSDGELWFYQRDAGARRLAGPTGRSTELEDLSPDGRFVACVAGNDLYVIPTAGDAARALTASGAERFLNGKLDWVYQEEVYGRGNFKAFWWSPDSKYIAFLSLDESAVYEFTVIDHIESGHFRVKPEITLYPKVGDPNPVVQFHVVEVATGQTVQADLAPYADQEPLIVRVDWTRAGDRVLFCVQDRIQTWADLNACDPASGQWRTLIHETNDSWVERPDSPRWLADGTFLWMSHRTDYQHVYRYSAAGELLAAVTAGPWAVRRILAVDEEKGVLWFTGTKDGAVNDNAYRVGLDGKGLTRLTEGDGQHSIDLNGDRSYFIDRWSTLTTPPAARLCRGDGKIVRELGKTEIKALEKYVTSQWELVEIRARDGFLLDAAVLKPVPFAKNRPHPVWLPTYSGPDAPSVRNGWNGSAHSQFLAQQGFVVFQVNVRSASGKGHFATEQCYRRLGVQELQDLEDAIDWLCAHRWADAARVGITGSSYGGFMAAFALTHSDRFALGIAGSGVYDWRMYDSIYTERYMSTPELNADGYRTTSVLAAAKDLKGRLLITHGVMDDNVHVQNALQLAYALQKAGKQFDLMLYPQSRHGIGDADLRWHDRQMEWELVKEVLRPAAE